MKATKIIVASLLVIAAIAYAAKTPDFSFDNFEGYTKPAGVVPVKSILTNTYINVETGVTNYEFITYYDFTDKLTDKGNVKFTKADGEIVIKASKGKMIAQKGGKVTGTINGVESGFNGVALKMKGITVGTVVGTAIKSAQVAGVTGTFRAGTLDKGTALKAFGSVEGTLAGNFKSIQAASFNEVDGLGIRVPKKLTIKAKSNTGKTFTMDKTFEGVVKVKPKDFKITFVDPNATPEPEPTPGE